MFDTWWCGRVLEGSTPSKQEPSAAAFNGAGVISVHGGPGLEQRLKGPDFLENEDVDLQGEQGVHYEVDLGGDTSNVPGKEHASRTPA